MDSLCKEVKSINPNPNLTEFIQEGVREYETEALFGQD